MEIVKLEYFPKDIDLIFNEIKFSRGIGTIWVTLDMKCAPYSDIAVIQWLKARKISALDQKLDFVTDTCKDTKESNENNTQKAYSNTHKRKIKEIQEIHYFLKRCVKLL